MRKPFHIRVVSLFAILFLLAGCTSPPPGGRSTARGDDPLVPGDIISVKIQGVADPPAFEGAIDLDGNIEMLYLGKLKAAELSPAELSDRIRYLLVHKGIYPLERTLPENMTITVLVGTRYYFITGEGPRGRYPMIGPVTVYRALLAAGGVGEFANMKKVILHRGDKRYRVNCLKAAIDPKYDMDVKAGDIIDVPKKGILPFL